MPSDKISIQQSPAFARKAKKLKSSEKKDLDSAVRAIAEDPEAGEEKVGDLAGIRVYKYRSNKLQVLLSYQYFDSENTLVLITFGAHENFYRDLKKYNKT